MQAVSSRMNATLEDMGAPGGSESGRSDVERSCSGHPAFDAGIRIFVGGIEEEVGLLRLEGAAEAELASFRKRRPQEEVGEGIFNRRQHDPVPLGCERVRAQRRV